MGLLFFCNLYAVSTPSWDYTHTYQLKKDAVATVEITKKDYTSQVDPDGKLYFRWTLYHNKLLVLLVNYEGYPTQHVLQKKYKRDLVRINLLGDYSREGERVFLLLKFTDFEKTKNIATVKAMILDPQKRIEVKFSGPE
ncbi:MAG: hypothetical protein K0U47_11605 [Epsilonproteobacteria bacterium]|nr:hypothetical protein [Campylobacterota bacterium]